MDYNIFNLIIFSFFLFFLGMIFKCVFGAPHCPYSILNYNHYSFVPFMEEFNLFAFNDNKWEHYKRNLPILSWNFHLLRRNKLSNSNSLMLFFEAFTINVTRQSTHITYHTGIEINADIITVARELATKYR